jgi:hypothetical protein
VLVAVGQRVAVLEVEAREVRLELAMVWVRVPAVVGLAPLVTLLVAEDPTTLLVVENEALLGLLVESHLNLKL